MSIEVSLNTPLADALSNVVQPKLTEIGWNTGGLDDSALGEYIILMLVNGKTQDQIAAELSNDLLSLGPEDTGATDFAQWLFEQVYTLNAQIQGSSAPQTQQPSQGQANGEGQVHGDDRHREASGNPDADMGEAMDDVQDGSMYVLSEIKRFPSVLTKFIKTHRAKIYAEWIKNRQQAIDGTAFESHGPLGRRGATPRTASARH